MRKLLLLAGIFISVSFFAQKTITVEDIWSNYIFYPSSASGFNAMKDGQHYTDIEQDSASQSIVKYDLRNGKKIEVLVKGSNVKVDGKIIPLDHYAFSPDETKLLLGTEAEPIYRRSAKTRNYVYDLKTGKTVELSKSCLLYTSHGS